MTTNTLKPIRFFLFFFYLLSTTSIHAQYNLTDLHRFNISHEFPALTATLPSSFLHCGFRNDFCTKEMMHKSFAFGWVRDQNCALLRASHYGYSAFGTLQLCTGYSRQFGTRIALYMGAAYLLQHAAHYPAIHSFTLDFSLQCQITNHTGFALYLYNPIRMRYGITGNQIIPMQFKLLLYGQLNKTLTANIFCNLTLPNSLDIGAQLLYHPTKLLFLTANLSTQSICAGIQIPCKKLIFHIQTHWFYKTSFSPQGAVSYLM